MGRSSLVHCSCLICPLSFLHQPIFNDSAAPPPSSGLAATYITLRNGEGGENGTWGFFASCPPQTSNSPYPIGYNPLDNTSGTWRPPVVCLNPPLRPFRVYKCSFSHSTPFIPADSHFPPPTTPPPTTSVGTAPNNQSFAAIVLRS